MSNRGNLRRQVDKVLASDKRKRRRGYRKFAKKYPTLAELREKAPEHVQVAHAQHLRQVESDVRVSGRRWYYSIEKSELTCETENFA